MRWWRHSASDSDGSLPPKLQHKLAPMRRAAVLEDVDALPGPEERTSILDRDREMRRQQGTADMRRHIIGALVVMPVAFDVLGRERTKKVLEIGADLGRGILLDQ